MEKQILYYLDEYYKGLPAFIFGSRVNHNSTEDSDWDVGIIGAKRRRRIGNIEFIPIDTRNIDKKCSIYPFSKEIFSMTNKIKPLVREDYVRRAERRVKENIVQYAIQKSGKQEVSGQDVVTFYTRKNAEVNPKFLRKGTRFLNSKNAIKAASESYDDVIKNYNPTKEINYRDYNLLDFACYLAVDRIRLFKEMPLSNVSDIFSHVKDFVDRTTVALKDKISLKTT